MHIIVMVAGHYDVHVADKNTILKEKHTHTLFMVFLSVLLV